MATIQARWQRRKQARPQEILMAALTVFAERGYAATRLDDVAKRAGVTKGTLYLYFPNKEQLFIAVVRGTLLPELLRIGEEAGAPSALASIDAIITSFEQLAASPVGAIPKLVLGEAGNFPEIARFYADEIVARGLAMIRRLLQRGVDSGEIRGIDVEHTAYCVVAPLLLAVLWTHTLAPHATAARFDIAALCRAHLDLMLNGLRPREVSR
jgi:AcrR family transcriptional regulator